MLFHIFCCLLLSIHHVDARPEPLGNSMNPQVHATALSDQINGTNVPLDEKSIEAPIEDQDEIDKIKNTVHDIAENGNNPENLPIIGEFAKKNTHLKSPTAAPTNSTDSTTQSSTDLGTTTITTSNATEVVLTTASNSVSSETTTQTSKTTDATTPTESPTTVAYLTTSSSSK